MTFRTGERAVRQVDVMRPLASLVCGLVLAACVPSGQPGATPPLGLGTDAPSPTARASSTLRPTPIPSATACAPFDLARETEPSVGINLASEPHRDETYGLNGSGALGDQDFPAGGWHQPAPQDALVVRRGELLLVDAHLDVDELPLCLASVTIDAAAFSPLAVAPESSALARLAASSPNEQDLATFGFTAPSEPGEWIIRVALTFATDPGPSRQESFFRLRVDVPPPAVAGMATVSASCATPGAHPPRAYLSLDGGSPVKGDLGSFTWGTTSGDGQAPIGPRVDASTAAHLTVTIGGEVCAAWWRIQLAPRPTSPWGHQEPFLDLVPAHLGSLLKPGKANHFELGSLPPGDWVVQSILEFADGHGNVIGQTTSFWNAVVD
jgi:hypothetical protein